jgi:hypothetical protein
MLHTVLVIVAGNVLIIALILLNTKLPWSVIL